MLGPFKKRPPLLYPMIDIHCHILPGVDDGASDMDESTAMAKIAADDGITRIVATPHVKDPSLSALRIQHAVEELNIILKEQNIPVTVFPGAEVNMLMGPSLLAGYTINGTNYIIIEFAYSHFPSNTPDIIFNLMIQGYKPIIAHPERNPSIIQKPRILFNMLDSGVLVQITADSLTGAFGRDIRACAVYLLKNNAVSLVGTDAHSAGYRSPILSEGLDVAEKIIGKKNAEVIFISNPEAIINGKTISRYH